MNKIKTVRRLSAAILLTAGLSYAGPVYYLATDQTGAQTQIDTNHTSTWTFTPNTQFDLGGGLFVMKDGQSTTADIRFSLFLGNDSSGTQLASRTLNHTSFCAQVSNCGNFDPHNFVFVSPIALTVGQSYFAALTSTAVDVQSEAYFIKSDSSFVSDSNGTPINPQPIGGFASTVPEPATGLLAFGGIAGVMYARRLRRRTR